MKNIILKIVDLVLGARKPEKDVKLVPVPFSKKDTGQPVKSYQHTYDMGLADFQSSYIEDNFYKIIESEPVFCRIKFRHLTGFFRCTTDGIDEPGAEIIAMWSIGVESAHPLPMFVYYIGNKYFAGDVLDPSNSIDRFHIRLLYEIVENV